MRKERGAQILKLQCSAPYQVLHFSKSRVHRPFLPPNLCIAKQLSQFNPSPSLASACLSQYCVAIFAIVPDRAQIGMFKEFFCKLSLPFAWQEISPPGPHHLYLARAQRACLQVLFPGFASDVREFHALASLAVGLGADL